MTDTAFPFPLAAHYYLDTRWHKLYGGNSKPGWRVDSNENHKHHDEDHATIRVCKTEAEAVALVASESWQNASPEEHVRFALENPEEARRLLDLYGDC